MGPDLLLFLGASYEVTPIWASTQNEEAYPRSVSVTSTPPVNPTLRL